MNRFLCLAAAGLALSLPVSAYAGPITTNINAYSPTAGTISGTVTVDTSTGTVTGVDLTLTDGLNSFLFDTIHYQESSSSEYYFTSYDEDGSGPDSILIGFAGSSLADFTTMTPICTLAYACGGISSFFAPVTGGGEFFASGTPTLTPEPSSLMLLGTGVLGVAGIVRRRFVGV